MLLTACEKTVNPFSSAVPTTKENDFPPTTDAYDQILGYGGGYFIVTKHTETYKDVYDEYGVVDIQNNWLHPLFKQRCNSGYGRKI